MDNLALIFAVSLGLFVASSTQTEPDPAPQPDITAPPKGCTCDEGYATDIAQLQSAVSQAQNDILRLESELEAVAAIKSPPPIGDDLTPEIPELELPEETIVSVIERSAYPVTRRGNYFYWTANGRQWNGPAISEGSTYQGGRWKYSNGNMVDMSGATNAQPSRSGGYWMNRCVNGVCTQVWVPN